MAVEKNVIETLLKMIASFGLGAVGGSSGMGGSGSVIGGSSAGSAGGVGPISSDFLYPIMTTGGAKDFNSVGRARDPLYAHGRTSQEQEELCKTLEQDFVSKNIGAIRNVPPGTQRAVAMRALYGRAKEYAAQLSMDRNAFKDYVPFSYAGISADKTTHVDPVASSSWVGDIRRLSPDQVEVSLNGKKYLYGGTPDEVERFLNSPSLGREINNIKQGNSSSLRRLWDNKA